MKVVFLGTGTSVGIPVIGCSCRVCTSRDPRNARRRPSLYVQAAGTHVVIDTSPDFREQVLTFRVPRVDAVLVTHSHADHIFGLDDIRRFNTLQRQVIPVYGSRDTIRDLRRVFDYVDAEPSPDGVYRPEVRFIEAAAPFTVGAIRVEPLRVEHGAAETFGFRLEAEGKTAGYVPDCHAMPPETLARFRGVDVMMLDGLRHRPHPTHLTVEASVRMLQAIGARHSYLTHVCHDLDHEETQASLPASMFVACDGLTLEW
jgi:phosphoribosyl 1,2-cyclic phosphate phosphodiesterase